MATHFDMGSTQDWDLMRMAERKLFAEQENLPFFWLKAVQLQSSVWSAHIDPTVMRFERAITNLESHLSKFLLMFHLWLQNHAIQRDFTKKRALEKF